ncbi:MAG: DUF4169 family protein [Rubrimonas sp.]|uniref:DUF4169 family protein n=1 Tax=Rubrimonas sp. TaxID=2036015 RepID=UPI002FDD1504
MTDAPINLRRARKARARAEARAQGDANAAAHGVPKAARDAASALTRLADRRLDGARVEDAPVARPKVEDDPS